MLTILSKVDDWQFDSFALERVSNGRPLSLLAFALFKRTDLTSRFGIDEQKLARWAELGGSHPACVTRTLCQVPDRAPS